MKRIFFILSLLLVFSISVCAQSAQELYNQGMALKNVKNKKKDSAQFFLQAAQKGHAQAMFELGYIYANTLVTLPLPGVDPNDKSSFHPELRKIEALKWYRKAAEQGNADAMLEIARFYREGKGGLKPNNQEALIWAEKAAKIWEKSGNADNFLRLGQMYTSLGNYVKAKEYFRNLAAKGGYVAMWKLGEIYEYYENTPNKAEAEKWYVKSVENGYKEKISELARFFYFGLHIVSKDYSKALKYFIKEAEVRDYGEAEYYIGSMYYKGEGVQKNLAEAYKWYRKSAEKKYDKGVLALAEAYEKGEGVKQDNIAAAKWYRELYRSYSSFASIRKEEIAKKLKKLDPYDKTAPVRTDADYVNGNMVLSIFGKDVDALAKAKKLYEEKNYSEAVKHYRIAAEQGSSEAQNDLGYCYQHGIGVEKDLVEAIKWYSKSADQSYNLARINLGLCYYNGVGVQQDLKEAFKLFHRAAFMVEPYGMYLTGACYYFGHGVERDTKTALSWLKKSAEKGCAEAKNMLKEIENIPETPVQKSTQKSQASATSQPSQNTEVASSTNSRESVNSDNSELNKLKNIIEKPFGLIDSPMTRLEMQRALGTHNVLMQIQDKFIFTFSYLKYDLKLLTLPCFEAKAYFFDKINMTNYSYSFHVDKKNHSIDDAKKSYQFIISMLKKLGYKVQPQKTSFIMDDVATLPNRTISVSLMEISKYYVLGLKVTPK